MVCTRPRIKCAPALTVNQRRRQIIDLLASHLARMPHALDVPPVRPTLPPGTEHDTDEKFFLKRDFRP